MNEQEIIRLLLAHDQRGMDQFLRHYGPLMRYIIAPILPDRQEQEECLSDVSMRVWENIVRYETTRGSWIAWLSVLTRNTALNRARQSRHRETEELTPDIPAPDSDPEEILLRKERQAHLKQIISTLSHEDAALFYRSLCPR